MTSKGDAIAEVLADMPSATAAEVVSVVYARYGLTVAEGSVRSAKSRANARGGVSAVREPARVTRSPGGRRPGGRAHIPPPEPIGLPVPDHAYAADDDAEPASDTRRPGARRPGARTRIHVPPEPTVNLPPDNHGSPEDIADDETVISPVEDRRYNRMLDQIIAAAEVALTGNPQWMDSSPVKIAHYRQVVETSGILEANPDLKFYVEPLPGGLHRLMLHNAAPTDSTPVEPVPVNARVEYPSNQYESPVIRRQIPRNRGKAHKDLTCEYCGRQKGYQTPQLYRVTGGAIGSKEWILCAMHAGQESAVGAEVRPYDPPVQPDRWGTIRPQISAYAKHIQQIARDAISSAGQIDVYPDSDYQEQR